MIDSFGRFLIIGRFNFIDMVTAIDDFVNFGVLFVLDFCFFGRVVTSEDFFFNGDVVRFDIFVVVKLLFS